jgi:hypothetical protein
MVITGTEKRQAPKSIQPGNTEWVTAIVAANARGWPIPPFIILKGAQQYDTWHQSIADRPQWVLSISEKGWTSIEHGFKWLKHFDKHTKASTTGAYRLLIMDGHDSHNSIEFRDYCKERNIITLCMPPHSSYLLQPLNIGCFGPLKRAYSKEIESLIRCRINHITKEDFLPAFKAAFDNAITDKNIAGGFRGTGLVPFGPDCVISKLDIQALRTPTPPLPEPAAWQSQTPHNHLEVECQTQYVQRRVARHQGSSPTSILDGLASLAKGITSMAHRHSILEIENRELRAANTMLTKRKERKRKVIKGVSTVSISDRLQLAIRKQEGRQIDQNGPNSHGRPRQPRRCGRYREPGHRINTCKIAPVETPSN